MYWELSIALSQLISTLESDIRKYEFGPDSFHAKEVKNLKKVQEEISTIRPIEE